MYTEHRQFVMFEAGSLVGDYRLEEVIARGGMGVVWKATDLNQDQFVAIKVIANDLMEDPGFRLRIQDEARRHQRLMHPNIVQVLDVMDYSGMTCIVMELVDGESLATVLDHQHNHRIPEDRARRVIKEVVTGLNYAHSKHATWHRDIKPSNILLDSRDHVHIIDFGIALAYGEERRTRTGQMLGTAEYMSPEQIVKPHEINHLTDVYSVGCVLYELLTGRPPFVCGEDGVSSTDFALQEAHVNKYPRQPNAHVKELSDDINQIVLDALEKDFENRIPGCGAFLLRLEQPQTQVSEQESEVKKKSVWLWLMGILVVVWLLAFVVFR